MKSANGLQGIYIESAKERPKWLKWPKALIPLIPLILPLQVAQAPRQSLGLSLPSEQRDRPSPRCTSPDRLILPCPITRICICPEIHRISDPLLLSQLFRGELLPPAFVM